MKRKRSKTSDVAISTGIPVTLLHHTGHQNQAVAYLPGWNINALHIAFQREDNCVIRIINNDINHWQKHPTQTRVHKPTHSKHTTPQNKNNYIGQKIFILIIITINVTPGVLKIQHGV